MSERTAEATTTVDEDGIRVEKSFTDDAFPVPAVMYELSSTREDPVRVRIVDRIPESFPMDRIGFHPEYESENWTAYKDHRVEFERVVDPGDDDRDRVRHPRRRPRPRGLPRNAGHRARPGRRGDRRRPGAGDTDAVREVLGDRATLPGMEQPLTAEGENSEPAAVDDEPTAEPEVIDDPGSRRSRRRIRGHGVSRTARGRCGNRSGHLTHRGAGRGRTGCGRASRRRAERCDDRGRRRRRVG